MDWVLRVILFGGLVFHKLLWQVLRRKSRSPKVGNQKPCSFMKASVKLGKVALLVFLGVQTLFLELLPILEEPIFLKVFGTVVYLSGLFVAVLGRVQLGNNWADLEDYRVLPEQSIVNRGIYGYIRHPIYTGDILLLFGLELALNSWLVLGVPVLIIIIVRQALAEEEILSKSFPEYSAYRARTNRFIPYVA